MSRTTLAATLLVLLTGCTFPAAVPTAVSPVTTAPPATSASAPSGPTSSVAPPSSIPPSQLATPPGVPNPAGAIDVSGGLASFASPSGRIWCATDGQAAWCHFPKGMTATVPASEEVCPGEGLDVTGVTVEAAEAKYFCSGDPTAFPVKGQASVAWHDATDFPWVKYDGFKLAVLPYGQKVVSGSFVCASEKNGVTCANTATAHGFRIALAGPVFF